MSSFTLGLPLILWILILRQIAGILLAIAAMWLCRREEKEKAAGHWISLRQNERYYCSKHILSKYSTQVSKAEGVKSFKA